MSQSSVNSSEKLSTEVIHSNLRYELSSTSISSDLHGYPQPLQQSSSLSIHSRLENIDNEITLIARKVKVEKLFDFEGEKLKRKKFRRRRAES